MLPIAALLCFQLGCHSHSQDAGNGHDHAHPHTEAAGHAHDEQGNHIEPDGSAPAPLVYTLYTGKTELFVEFAPLVVGVESRFAAHFTALGESFKAISQGSVTLSLVNARGTVQSVTADKPEVPGIFRLRLTPERAEKYSLVFDIKTADYTDQITIEGVEVFPDEGMVLENTPSATTAAGAADISFLKEQAWKIEFANAPARVQPFSEVVRTSGRILAAPGDEALLSAQISGIVSYAGNNLVAGSPVLAGATLFSVKSNEVVQSNLSAAVKQAENDLATAQKQYDRAAGLVQDKIVSEKEFLEAKLRLENAQAQLRNVSVSSSFNKSMQSVSAPISGYLKNVLVENGQFVHAGQPLAAVSKNRRLLLQANVSQKYFSKLSAFSSANFKIAGSDQVFSTKSLNGRILATGRSAEAGAPFLPISFEIDNSGSFVPGSAAEIFLQAGASPALVIPVSALLEEQGVFYAYVQTGGESFQKRELQTGASDGMYVQVLSGISEGERVVIKGAYQIKLANVSGALPAHGHEH